MVVVDEIDYECSETLVVSSSKSDGTSILESRCTFHVTPYKKWFVDYKDMNDGIVHIENNHLCNVMRVGSVRLCINDGSTFVINNVRHVLELKKIFISLGTLDSMGYIYKGEHGQLRICRGSLVNIKGIQRNEFYYLDVIVEINVIAVSHQEKNVNL